MEQAQVMMIPAMQIGSFLDEKLCKYGGHLWRFLEVEENQVKRGIAILICHVNIDFKYTICPRWLCIIRLYQLVRQFKFTLGKRHM